MSYVVAVGEWLDGLTFYGPFDEFEDAQTWAENNSNLSWWIIKLETPND